MKEKGLYSNRIQSSQDCWEGLETRRQAKVTEIQHLTHNRLGLMKSRGSVCGCFPADGHRELTGQQPCCGDTLCQGLHLGSNGKLLHHCQDGEFNILASTCPGQNERSCGSGQPRFASPRQPGPSACVLSGGRSGSLNCDAKKGSDVWEFSQGLKVLPKIKVNL